MATQRQVDVSALRIQDGERLAGEIDELGNMGVLHGGRERGSLYVLANAYGVRRTEIEEMLVSTITDAFQRSTGSVTGALLEAIQEANRLVFEDNKQSFPNQRTGAGVYCALVRPGHDLVLAYAGPAIALLIGPAGVERLYSDLEPARPRSPGQGKMGGNDVGATPEIEVSFFSSAYNPGDILVLASPSLLETGLDDDELALALNDEGVDGLPDGRDLSVLLLAYAVQAAEPVHEPAPATRDPSAKPTVSPAGWIAAAAKSAVKTLIAMFQPRPSAPASEPPAPAVHSVEPSPSLGTTAQPAPLPEWLDEGTEKAGRQPQGSSAGGRPSLHLPALRGSVLQIGSLAAVALLILAAIWWQGHSQAQQREQSFQALLIQAQNERTLGQASLDRTQAVAHLTNAGSLVDQALSIKPEAPAALALRDGVLRDMDVAKGVTRLLETQVTTLYTFSAPGAGLGRVVGDGSSLYVLDKGAQTVHKLVLNAQGNGVQPSGDSVLVRKGDVVAGTVVGDLVDIAWIPLGGNRRTSNLVILEGGGKLIQYDVTKGLSILPVKDSTAWRKAQATGGYGGNFYILDNLANTILRYRATSRGYDDTPSAYLQTKVDLATAVDMAIDGDIFVLTVNGQIIFLSGGKPKAYLMEGLDRPLSAPVAIFTNEGTAGVYVADPSNSRVVMFSKQGVTLKQFVYEDKEGAFQRLRGIFVDEKKLSLYATAGVKLIHIALPK